MKRVLVSGGCGFIGINLLPELKARYEGVRVLDDLSAGHREDAERLGVELQAGDVRNELAVARAMEGAEAVVHLAAHTHVIDSVQNPVHDFEVNARGTLNLLRAAVDHGVRRFVLASTGGAILGEQEPPVHEGMVPRPLSPYGAGKLAAEGYASAFFGSYGLETVALRFSNVYGPYSYHKASVVAAFFKSLLKGQPLVVYGDGNQTRDFLYAGDVVQAVLLALEKSPGGEVFQIATGRETSINQLVEEIRQVIPGVRCDVHYEPARRGEVQRNYSDIGKARRVLGYVPRTGLPEGLIKTWEWFTSRKEAVLGRGQASH